MTNVAINVSNCVAGGGRAIAEWFLQEVARRGLPENLNISLIANDVHSEVLDHTGFEQILTVAKSPVRSGAVRRRIHRFLRQNKIGVLFSLFGPSGLNHGYQIGGVANAFVTSDHRRLLQRMHGRFWLPHDIKYRVLRHSLKSRYKHIVFETDSERKNFLQLTGYDAVATDVIANSVAPEIVAASHFSFRPLTSSSDELRLLVVTSDYGHKNNDMLWSYLAAVRDIWSGSVSMAVTLTPAQLQQAQGSVSIDPGLRPLGRLSPPALAQAYIDADVVLMPSLLETYSAVYNEVRFFGKPLLCSDIPSAREICEGYAVFFDPQDLDQFISKFRQLLSERRDIAERTWATRHSTISPGDKFELIAGLISHHAKIATSSSL